MGRVRVLDDQLVNRIAAGEVVERPASVVKELIENSLDAGAGAVDVTLEDGGRTRIVVADDGVGMDRDDALLALERHATSKLRRFEDLDAIATLGFRGEALPSIAAVSRFLLQTAAREGDGTEVEVRGGRIGGVRDLARARGTTIEVGGLFFNVPARRKFLRAAATELAHALRVIVQQALARPGVRFRVVSGGRRILEAAPAAGLAERLAQVHGRELAERLVPFEDDRGGVHVTGFAGRPAQAGTRRDSQHLFVNGRAVRDRVLAHAIAEAYGDAVPKGLHPEVLLFLTVDASRVDVNVHPQKGEVRFARASEVHDAVRDALAAALSEARVVPTYADLQRAAPRASVAAAALRYLDVAEPEPPAYGGPAAAREGASPAGLLEEGSPAIDTGRRAVPLAQYRDSYIVAEDREGLLLIDQHVAHERVLYERYLAEAERGEVAVQRLLFPKTIEVTAEEAVLLEAEAPEFARLGFPLEAFGDGAIKLEGVPAFAKDAVPERLLRELLGEAGRTRSAATGTSELRRRLVTTAACHAAIKVNHPLTREGMQRLLDDLFQTENPSTCPHGRPILFRLTREEIERAFRRR